jgi:hypothetical protein
MNKIASSALIMLLLLAPSFLLGVQEGVDKRGKNEISGTIKQVSATVRRVTIETANKAEKTVSVEPETKITIGGKEGTLDDLKEGQSIRVVLFGESSKAVSIDVT